MALARCGECREADVTSEWLRTLRLSAWAAPLGECGVKQLVDFIEVLDEELHLMGLPLLQRRRFLIAASAVPGVPGTSAEAAVRTLAEAAADCAGVEQWLCALRLGEYASTMLSDGIGCAEPADFRELLLSDLDAMQMPPIQQRRFLAAVRLLPEPPELPGRRWETPPKWLESLRLEQFWPAMQTMGVDRVGDFAEILTVDLDDMGMPALARRRFMNAVSRDTAPTAAMSTALALTDGGSGDKLRDSRSTGADVLTVPPHRWLATLRCESFIDSFERLGVEKVIDFAEVLVEDLIEMQLPLLHRRRFAQAAAEAEAAQAAQRASAVPRYPAGLGPSTPEEWLRDHRLDRFAESFGRLGVEHVCDFPEVLHNDLVGMGMPPLQMRRFLRSVTKQPGGGGGGSGRGLLCA